MNIKVRMNKTALKQISAAQITALEMTAEAVKTDVIAKNVMPFDLGTMQNESTMIDTSMSRHGIVTIPTDTPYSRRLYFHPEYNFNKDKNPYAKGRWYDDWINGKYKAFPLNAFRTIYKRLTGV